MLLRSLVIAGACKNLLARLMRLFVEHEAAQLAAKRTNAIGGPKLAGASAWRACLKKKFKQEKETRQTPAEDAWRQLLGSGCGLRRHTRVEIAIALA